uniref:Uncharacterized protein n=1 Tax=Anguilla anguilla TaxID=7936 RepID=A0A0E9V640_ANGAN
MHCTVPCLHSQIDLHSTLARGRNRHHGEDEAECTGSKSQG